MYRYRFALNNVLSVKDMPWHTNGLTLSYPFLRS